MNHYIITTNDVPQRIFVVSAPTGGDARNRLRAKHPDTSENTFTYPVDMWYPGLTKGHIDIPGAMLAGQVVEVKVGVKVKSPNKENMTDLEIALGNLTDVLEGEGHKLSDNGRHVLNEAIEQLAIFPQLAPPPIKWDTTSPCRWCGFRESAHGPPNSLACEFEAAWN